MDLAHHPASASQWAFLLSTSYHMCGYSQEGDINIIYLLGFLVRSFFSPHYINASAGYGHGQKWRGLKRVFILNLWSSQDECLLRVEPFLSGMCVWEIYINNYYKTWSALMKAFIECQGNPEAQQTNSPGSGTLWKGFLGGIPCVNGGLALHEAGMSGSKKHEWKDMMRVENSELFEWWSIRWWD